MIRFTASGELGTQLGTLSRHGRVTGRLWITAGHTYLTS
jgi:hypothetical protein